MSLLQSVISPHDFLNFDPVVHVNEVDRCLRLFGDENIVDVFLKVKLKVLRIFVQKKLSGECLDLNAVAKRL